MNDARHRLGTVRRARPTDVLRNRQRGVCSRGHHGQYLAAESENTSWCTKLPNYTIRRLHEMHLVAVAEP